VPFSEQKMKMKLGGSYIVHVHLDDESYRIVASAKVERYLSKERPDYRPGTEVDALIWQKTDLGFKAIVDNSFAGQLYDNEIFSQLHTGDRVKAYIKRVREDGKIDLVLQHWGMSGVDGFSERLLQYITDNGGTIPFTDKSDASDIYSTFEVSKKTFKRAVGDLYKKRLITLGDDSISLVEKA
jgi:hypothetical protein